MSVLSVQTCVTVLSALFLGHHVMSKHDIFSRVGRIWYPLWRHYALVYVGIFSDL